MFSSLLLLQEADCGGKDRGLERYGRWWERWELGVGLLKAVPQSPLL